MKIFKSLLSFICIFATLLSFFCVPNVSAVSGSNSKIKWSINKNGVLSISRKANTGTTTISDYSTSNTPPWKKYNSSIKYIIINSNITKIGSYAFWGLTNVKQITIGKNVKEMGTAPFGHCDKLSSFKVASGNSSYKTSAGVLYNYSKSTIVAYPANKSGKTFTCPSTVKTIKGFAFSYNQNLTKFTQDSPGTIVDIKSSAFRKSKKLETITLKNNIKEIGNKAFYDITTLKGVTIPPSVVSIGNDIFLPSSKLKKLRVYCSLGSKIYDKLSGKGYVLSAKKWNFSCKFDANGGKINKRSKTVIYNENYGELPTPVKEGYKFSGWYVDNKLITANTKVSIAKDHTLKASFEGKQYVVELNPNFGICDTQKITVTYGKPFGELPEAVKNGYEFLGWYTQDGQKVYTDTLFTNENINILIAKYRKNVSATTGLKIKYKTKNSVRLAWNKQRDVTGYEVFKKVNSGKYTNCAVVTQNYTTLSLKAKKRYTFKVRAFVIDGDSKQYGDFSSEVSRAKTYLAKPKLKKSVSKSGVLTVKWKSVSNAKKYQIFQYKNRKWKKVKTTTATKIYVLTKPHKTYRFKVRAFCTVLKHRCYSAFGKIKHKA
jgi:uncharacterized repeat protein (TIGR02543 family)